MKETRGKAERGSENGSEPRDEAAGREREEEEREQSERDPEGGGRGSSRVGGLL